MVWLEESGDRTVAFSETRLKPEIVSEAEILALVRRPRFRQLPIRQKAFARGEALAKIAKKQLREQLEATKSAEVRYSLRRLLSEADDYSIRDPERLRCVRAIECLEVIGGARARRLLTRLAQGSPSSPVTQDASAALVRMEDWISGD